MIFSDPNPFNIPTHLQSRSICFENITGAKGEGGKAASPLGIGRKGAPARHLFPGETIELAAIDGPGMIRHIWMTCHPKIELLRGVVLRFYWNGQTHPSIETPVGDFFGFAHGKTPAFQSAAHSVGEKVGMNAWIPMPFAKHARVTITNEGDVRMPLFYQIDYTLGDDITDDTPHLHVSFQRQNPTALREDFEFLNRSGSRGRYLGAVFGVIPHDPRWWGEGEVKVFLDGDSDFATIVGTGAEDYVGLSWGIQQTPFLYHGANWREKDDMADTGAVSMYRWHFPDPIYWQSDIRLTIQQIGHSPGAGANSIAEYQAELYERQDDWSIATFWYETLPSAPLPPLPDVAARLAALDTLASIDA
ncbi:glycoside hydrolase family 172 protein [Gimibacter soli]|uniref:DUF2961 domain-containing protein n=1 Tax=Gimibacter soli TaxID=3024400 RepID=A0AAE9XSL5_9PROT|nr:glycoside hydrolase family 172 protein [Gimibacter soli]WCL55571.1 DUF2961 domain-containing protein [Gimibacter soli]